ncbi:hypothetical protein DAI12_08715 [Enterococcus faecalis]|nr:lipoprotein [Enterococcus faecalis EnGen0085]PTN87856.1 hypothetical protein DAI12_08715 [Enterococcus faecalis]
MIRKTILASSILGVGLLIGACGNQTQTQMNSTNTSESSQHKVTESSRKSSESASKNQTTIKKVTDNEYKRILVMEEKATGTTYKSILIKKQNRLKIVNETTDELLYNGTL